MKPVCIHCPILLFVLIACSCSSSHPGSRTGLPPNIFLFLADDLGRRDLGVTGNRLVHTPHIDSFANRAVEFTRMYTPTAMCAPSRSSLYTGLYPHRHGCHMNHGKTYDHIKTLPRYLERLGYRVALVGKKHIRPKDVYPFDYVHFDSLEHYMMETGPPVCVIYASNEPHGPHTMGVHDPDSVVIPPKWVDTEATREKLAGYYTDISILDAEFERFLEAIRQSGHGSHAITIFTSDHGFEYFAKWSCYEAGLRVPFFLKASNEAYELDEVGELTSFVDLVPTFVEMAGGEPSDTLDGSSLVPLLEGGSSPLHAYIYGAQTTRGIYSGRAYPIRSITDGRYKYIRNLNHEQKFQNVLTNGWNFGDTSDAYPTWKEWLRHRHENKWVEFYQFRPQEELYDLKEDPHELNNLAGKEEFRHIQSDLSGELDRWMNGQNDRGMASELEVPLKRRDGP